MEWFNSMMIGLMILAIIYLGYIDRRVRDVDSTLKEILNEIRLFNIRHKRPDQY